ncbi:MAG: hypothetical protein GWO20_07265 [Candidatus Korarchaeota archaeon]|nr:hypothetical protein [Candidatus Korarchaeota archaeon]NIU83241.1 hypothetical protein [Candidatus Thorarchaeota archaeon]NIW13588.1 hypothetical protein [Candidatus Thorarchaeota archaeon]NIW51694.1 hypothetical protein [Candidatus Korarchaeota archaeon]
MSIKGEALKVKEDIWEDELYLSSETISYEDTVIKAIPYYGWDHRTPGEMRVWIRTE